MKTRVIKADSGRYWVQRYCSEYTGLTLSSHWKFVSSHAFKYSALKRAMQISKTGMIEDVLAIFDNGKQEV